MRTSSPGCVSREPGRPAPIDSQRHGWFWQLIGAACLLDGVGLRRAIKEPIPGYVVPDALERLLVVAACAGGVPDYARIQVSIGRQRTSEFDEFSAAVVEVPAHLDDAEPEACMPFNRAAELI